MSSSFHFFVFRFWVKVTEKRKNQLSFSGKMSILYTENKQTGQLISSFFVTLNKKKEKWNEPDNYCGNASF